MNNNTLKNKEKKFNLQTLGFTLIELLGVILLIGLVATVTVPVVKNIIKESKEKVLEEQKTKIVESAKSWGIKNNDKLPDSGYIIVKLETLKKEGLLENKKIINPVTKKEMNACVKIINNEDYNQYEYEYLDDCE